MSQFLIIAALIVFAFACRTFENRYIGKAGWLAMLVATYLGAYFLTGSHAAGGAALALWFFLPWLEILGRVRKMRFPMESEVTHRHAPSYDLFPDLNELSGEAEAAGFVETEDIGWKWNDTDHFARLFYHAGLRTQAAVTLVTQSDFALSYVSLTSRLSNGRVYSTSNFPFRHTLEFSPDHKLKRYADAASFDDLLACHAAFLKANAVPTETLVEVTAEQLTDCLSKDMRGQIAHNLSVGLLEPAGEGLIRYSWRGCVFMWLQVVKDMIRV